MNFSTRCTDGRSIRYTPIILLILRLFWYSEYSEYSQYQQPKYCQYLGASQVENPKILGSTARFHRIEPRNSASMAVSSVQNLKILRVLAGSRSTWGPNTPEYTKHLKWFLSEILYFTPKYWEYLCKVAVCWYVQSLNMLYISTDIRLAQVSTTSSFLLFLCGLHIISILLHSWLVLVFIVRGCYRSQRRLIPLQVSFWSEI